MHKRDSILLHQQDNIKDWHGSCTFHLPWLELQLMGEKEWENLIRSYDCFYPCIYTHTHTHTHGSYLTQKHQLVQKKSPNNTHTTQWSFICNRETKMTLSLCKCTKNLHMQQTTSLRKQFRENQLSINQYGKSKGFTYTHPDMWHHSISLGTSDRWKPGLIHRAKHWHVCSAAISQ